LSTLCLNKITGIRQHHKHLFGVLRPSTDD